MLYMGCRIVVEDISKFGLTGSLAQPNKKTPVQNKVWADTFDLLMGEAAWLG